MRKEERIEEEDTSCSLTACDRFGCQQGSIVSSSSKMTE